jgi:hypothetical protein
MKSSFIHLLGLIATIIAQETAPSQRKPLPGDINPGYYSNNNNNGVIGNGSPPPRPAGENPTPPLPPPENPPLPPVPPGGLPAPPPPPLEPKSPKDMDPKGKDPKMIDPKAMGNKGPEEFEPKCKGNVNAMEAKGAKYFLGNAAKDDARLTESAGRRMMVKKVSQVLESAPERRNGLLIWPETT